MTIEEAINVLEDGDWLKDYICYRPRTSSSDKAMEKLLDAITIALHHLRAQQEAEKNEPLTLEELLAMVGKPTYMVFSQKDEGRWYLITSTSGEKINFCDSDANTYYCYKNDYGPEWVAYLHPPSGIEE